MDLNKEKDLEYIKKFKSITIDGICKEFKIDKSNVYRGRASAETTRKVVDEIKRRIKELEDQ